MIVINLFGPPGSGKSTTAAGLFHLMKLDGRFGTVELVTEYAKDLVWAEREKELQDQLYVTTKQLHRLEILRNKVNYVITDSPLLLGLVYVPVKYRYSYYTPLVKELHDSFDSVNFLLHRVKPFDPIGRLQTEDESDAVGERIKNILDTELIPYQDVLADKEAAEDLLLRMSVRHDTKLKEMSFVIKKRG